MAGFSRKRMAIKKRPMKRTYKKKTLTVSTLARQVRALQKKTAQVTERDTYQLNEAIDVGSTYVVRNLCNYDAWNKLWPSTTGSISDVRSSMYHRYFTLDNIISLDNTNNEEGEVNFTYFIVSRKDESGSASDTTNNLGLGSSVDYTGTAGLVYMNPKKWKIHYVKRFTLTGGDGADMQADRAMIRFRSYIKVGKKVTNPDGSWKALTNSPDPSDTYYAILFNDNSTADLENPRWKFNAIHVIDN